MGFTKIQEKLLLIQVGYYPVLYDNRDPDFKNKFAKDQVWTFIGIKLEKNSKYRRFLCCFVLNNMN